MEINRYMELYKKHSPRVFYDWISRGRVMELRFLHDYKGEKFSNWQLIQTLADEFNIPRRYNSLFVNSYDQIKNILLYKIGRFPLTKIYNIYIGVNPRRQIYMKSKNGLLYMSYQGSIAATSHIQNALCDIELKDRQGSATEEQIERCINGARFLVKTLDLKDYYINVSGNGSHLWISFDKEIEMILPSFKETEGKIIYNKFQEDFRMQYRTYNRFIEKLDRILQSFDSKLKVDDGAKDVSRVARFPGSWNVKAGKIARAVGTVEMSAGENLGMTDKFWAEKKLVTPRTKKNIKTLSLSKNHRYSHLDIKDAPIAQLMTSKLLPSILSRNHYLEQSFACLLRDNNISIEKVYPLIEQMNEVQQKNVQVDPLYLEDDEPFNPEAVNSYCIGCKIDIVYPILETIPEITEGFITEKHYLFLDAYSESVINRLAIDIERPASYLQLKETIRKLVDQYDRSVTFFSLKKVLKDDWEYYTRNKIILQLLNKTRRRKND